MPCFFIGCMAIMFLYLLLTIVIRPRGMRHEKIFTHYFSFNIGRKNATLTFNAANGEEHLTANFDNWYKLDVIKNGMGEVIWVNTDDCGRRIPTEYVVKDTPLAGGVQNESVYFNTEFYGDDNIPAEAVALFQYQQKVMDTPKEGGGNLNIFLGFGGRTK